MKIWGILVLSAIIAFMLLYFGDAALGMSPVANCFKETGAEFAGMYVEGRSMIETSDNPEEVAAKLFKFSGKTGEFKISREGEMVELSYSDNECDIKVDVRKIQNEKMVYACFTLSQHKGIENINSIRRTISNAFFAYEVKPSFSSLIQGIYKEEMTIDNMKQKACRVLIKSGAAFIDGMSDRNMVSVFGYLPGIDDKVKVSNRYANLNIALRYSKSNGCTYIWIGSPVIEAEY